MNKRIGPRMAEVYYYVQAHPGRSMVGAALHCGPRGSLRYGYRTVHRAIAAGIVIAEPGPRGSTLLYPNM